MIRINLLPQKKQARRGGSAGLSDDGGESQLWLAAVLGALLLEAVVLLFVYKTNQDELNTLKRRNNEVRANIETIKRDVEQHTALKNELTELRAREQAIQKLRGARTGPTLTMLELSRIMTPGKGPSVEGEKVEQLRRDNPSAVPNPNWDPRRLWLTGFREQDRVVKLTGFARDGEDVSEFLRRLSLSDYFAEAKLLPASKAIDVTSKVELVKFEMSAKVRY